MPQRFDNFRVERLEKRIPAEAVEVIVPAAVMEPNAVWPVGRRVRVTGVDGKSASGRRTLAVGQLTDIVRLTERPADETLFPTHVPGTRFLRFPAAGFGHSPACGVVYRKDDLVTNGMPLGGIDTGCLDLETNGILLVARHTNACESSASQTLNHQRRICPLS